MKKNKKYSRAQTARPRLPETAIDRHREAIDSDRLQEASAFIRVHRLLACSAATLLLAGSAGAVEWTVTPNLMLGETYTDNVRLAPRGQEQSDFISQINPGISLRGVGPRLSLTANYQLQTLFYADQSSSNTFNHMLNAVANAELVDNLFYLDARAGISQQNISLLGAQAADNANLTGNRTEVRTLSLSPYLRKRFGIMASGEARYTHETVDTAAAGLNSQADRVNLRLDSGPAFGRFGWGVNYAKDKTDFAGLQENTEREVYSGRLSYLLRPGLTVLGTAGRETNDYLFSGPSPEGSFWTAGFSWAITPRTELDASVGHRFFGDTHALGFSHRSRRTVWSVNYSQDITTTQSQFFVPTSLDTAGYLNMLFTAAIPDPALRQQFVENFMVQAGIPASLFNPLNFLTNQTFLEKKLVATLALNGARNTVVLNAFDQIRDAATIGAVTSVFLGRNDFTQSAHIEQRGGSAIWNFRFAPRTSLNVSGGYSRSNFRDIGREDRDKFLKVGVTRQIEPKMTASLDFRRLQRDSNVGTSDYIENAVLLTLYMTF
ncbi:MAG: TIGR03016 family PEP-CTERM system-associated outer membrane protein [Sulfuricella sp.]|nr:TIGR03016 family PEP-CTERM system-associated outer membrane protein [Sulfuricella sp.]